MRPGFIAVEGIDGAGSTTFSALLAEALRSQGQTVLLTSEPSSGYVGLRIRQLLSSGMQPNLAALLFAADRVDHLEREIRPALEKGQSVICCRYILSSVAYQGTLLGDWDWVETLNLSVRSPDFTVLLDVPVSVANSRRVGRAVTEVYEKDDLLTAVARAYRVEAEHLGRSAMIVDATKPPEILLEEVLDRLQIELGEGE